MGLFSRIGQRTRERLREQAAPYNEARNEVWNAEIARLGEQEFDRRRNAISDYQLGRTGPSGFEQWQRDMDEEIMQRALRLGAYQDARTK